MPLITLILCYFSQVVKNVLVTTFLVNHIFSSKYMFTCYYPARKYRSLESAEVVPSIVPRSLLNILFDHPGMLSSDLLRKSQIWRPRDVPNQPHWDVFWLASSVPLEDVLRTWWGRLLDVPKFNFIFFLTQYNTQRGI